MLEANIKVVHYSPELEPITDEIKIIYFNTDVLEKVLSNHLMSGLITQEQIDAMVITDVTDQMTEADEIQVEKEKMDEGRTVLAKIHSYINKSGLTDTQVIAILTNSSIQVIDALIAKGSFRRALDVLNTLIASEVLPQVVIDFAILKVTEAKAKFPEA